MQIYYWHVTCHLNIKEDDKWTIVKMNLVILVNNFPFKYYNVSTNKVYKHVEHS
jgi:hypothetical protein